MSTTPRRRRRTPVAQASAALPVLAYLRVSTEEQADSGAGLAAQRAAIEAEAARRGWIERLEWVVDDGHSAKDLRRPGIAQALDDLAAGRAGTLVAAKLDRLSRSVLDFAALMATAEREGWALVLLDLGVDTTTPAGELMAGVMAQFAQYERRLIGQRTRDALAARKAAGVRLGRRSTLPPDVVAWIVAARQAGRSYRAVAEELNAGAVPTGQGGAKWWPATVRTVERSQQGAELSA